MRLFNRRLVAFLALCFVAALPAAAGPSTATGDLRDLATRLVRAYHAGDAEALRPYLAEGLAFRDPGLDQRLDLAGFLEMVRQMGGGESDRKLEITWAGLADDRAEIRGVWSWTDTASGSARQMRYAIELGLETAGQVSGAEPRVVSWLDQFRRRSLWKPARGDGHLATEHFRVDYFPAEFSADDAARLGETLEHWYEKTRRYLDRSFADGLKLTIDIAGCHDSPYASDPGAGAFILVPTKWAKLDYGFSLVHELTHNLMGLSWLSEHERERGDVALSSGNRLFDEGFAVYVEEKLTGEGPHVWPNFGVETHAAYQQLRTEKGEPIWPVLDAEIHREQGDPRLGYLAQASFCKYLVETRGLDRFSRLYASDPAMAKEVYGEDFPGLEREWRMFLEERIQE